MSGKSGNGLDVVCELYFTPDRVVSAEQAKRIEKAIEAAVADAFAGVRLKSLYVHLGVHREWRDDSDGSADSGE